MRSYDRPGNCKNCGTAPTVFSDGRYYWVKCGKCGKRIQGWGDTETAIAKWNNTRKTGTRKLAVPGCGV